MESTNYPDDNTAQYSAVRNNKFGSSRKMSNLGSKNKKNKEEQCIGGREMMSDHFNLSGSDKR